MSLLSSTIATGIFIFNAKLAQIILSANTLKRVLLLLFTYSKYFSLKMAVQTAVLFPYIWFTTAFKNLLCKVAAFSK